MTGEQGLALPDENQFKKDILAITRFQQIVRANMIEGHDFGVFPGITKPTLFKPGAEKIAKLLGLADHYQLLTEVEDWEHAFFHYKIKCSLVTLSGFVVSEGIGSCNSKETKYRYRWLKESDLPEGINKSKVFMEWRTTKTGGKFPMYRIDNDEIFSLTNTILKMAKKRALVDASLSAGRLSDLFTQDIEDLNIAPNEEELPNEDVKQTTSDKVVGGIGSATIPQPKEHWCAKHNVAYGEKKGKYGSFWSHRLPDGTFCNESKSKKANPQEPPPETEVAPTADASSAESLDTEPISKQLQKDITDGLNQLFKEHKWELEGIKERLSSLGGKGKTPQDMVNSLSQDMALKLLEEIQEVLHGGG